MDAVSAGNMDSVNISQKVDGSWQALHVPSGKTAHGLSQEEARESMKGLLGMDDDGSFSEPKTSDMFDGIAREIAEYLEGPVSSMLAFHSGYARLEAYAEGIASVRLGGGCQGCPSSRITLMNGVFKELQEKFGDEAILDIQPVVE